MKSLRKILSLIITASLMIMLVACSGSDAETTDEDETSSAETAAEDETETEEETEAVSSRTAITIAISGSRLPYSLKEGDDWEGVTADYENWDDEWTGVEAEMWKEIISRTGWELTIIQTDFSSVFGELDVGRADLAANYYSINSERTEKYYVSIPWSSDPQVIVLPEDSTLTTLEETRGFSIAVTAGQSSQTVAEEYADDYDWEIVTYEGIVGYEDVMYGRVDALAGSALTAAEMRDTNNYDYQILDEVLEAANVGYFVQQTEEGQALLDELNPILEDMLADGTISEILEKWLYEDMTAYIVED